VTFRCRFAWALASAALGSCTSRPTLTQAVIEVEAEGSVVEALSRITAEVYREDATDSSKAYDSRRFNIGEAERASATSGPLLSFGVTQGREDRFLLVVEGFRAADDEPAIEHKALVSFVSGRTIRVRIRLAEACLDRATECSSLTQTCSAYVGQGFDTCTEATDAPSVVVGTGGDAAVDDLAGDPLSDAGREAEDAVQPDSTAAEPLDGGTDGAADPAITVTFVSLSDQREGLVPSYAAGVTADGRLIVGTLGSGDAVEAIKFYSDGRIVHLGHIPSVATAVSPSGDFIGGSAAGVGVDGGASSVRWMPDGGIQRLVSQAIAGQEEAYTLYTPRAVADDGQLVCGCQQYGNVAPLSCLYTAPTQASPVMGNAYAIGEGGVFAGGDVRFRYATPTYAYYAGESLPYPDGVRCGGPQLCEAFAYAFNPDGFVVGWANTPEPGATSPSPPLVDRAFLYRPDGECIGLPDLTGGETASRAFAISTDARIIAGVGNDATGAVATVWIDGVVLSLERLVREYEGAWPSGFRAESVNAISSDGRVFVGNGTSAEGMASGFRVEFSRPPLESP
jgi:uncharacterized membrane protein